MTVDLDAIRKRHKPRRTMSFKNEWIESDVCICGQIAKRCDAIQLCDEVERLRKALELTLRDCEFLHHNKRDQHDHGERCPVEVRVREALEGSDAD